MTLTLSMTPNTGWGLDSPEAFKKEGASFKNAQSILLARFTHKYSFFLGDLEKQEKTH